MKNLTACLFFIGLSWSLLAQTELQKTTYNPAVFPDNILGLSVGIGTDGSPSYAITWHAGVDYLHGISSSKNRITHLGFHFGFQNQIEIDAGYYYQVTLLGLKVQNSHELLNTKKVWGNYGVRIGYHFADKYQGRTIGANGFDGQFYTGLNFLLSPKWLLGFEVTVLNFWSGNRFNRFTTELFFNHNNPFRLVLRTDLGECKNRK